MKRLNFLKGLPFGGVGMSLPGIIIKGAENNNKTLPSPTGDMQQKILLETYIAGYQHHEGKRVEKLLKPGISLNMVREPQNQYDCNAIAMFFKNIKIGYIPAADNTVLANMLDSHLLLTARILAVNPDLPTWERTEVEILLCFRNTDLCPTNTCNPHKV